MRPMKLGVLEETHRCPQCPLSSYCGGQEHHRLPSFPAHQWSSKEGSLLLGASEGALAWQGVGLLGFSAEGGAVASLPGTPGENF